MCSINENIFHSYSEKEFEQIALDIFHFQYFNNEVYQKYCRYIHVKESKINKISQIPFLPISFFKTHRIQTTAFVPELTFQSSGTTGMSCSYHYVKSQKLYRESLYQGFSCFYQQPEQYVFLALLPSYIEQQNSSLIFMMDTLMKMSGAAENGYYLHNYRDLYDNLLDLQKRGRKTILWGVTFALLDFIEHYQLDFPELIVFETGGMKGRRKEMIKEELYEKLKKAFGVPQIHSEYGMCELLSQAYSQGENQFFTPPWMRLYLRDEKDPLASMSPVSTGVVNVIDFANLYSCSFVATEDLGRKHKNGGIEILGRVDNSQLRGCNLLVVNNL